jgi:dolichol kinase
MLQPLHSACCFEPVCCKIACIGMHAEKLAFGARQELLRGPLFYVLIMTAVTVVFWRESPVGMMVLSLMCGGDGLADIIGRKFGTAKLPFNTSKSWAGSAAMFAGKLHSGLLAPLACQPLVPQYK